jgi:hypothetical protein|tara:strand:- start:1260 stop:1982 length:723 start_codon:yes stop_codon:yes gene_type:complete
MKINEALIIGGALLVALVLSKGGAASPNVKAFPGKSTVSVLPIENETQINSQINIIPKTISQITKIIITPPKVTQIDISDQLKNIFNIETEKKDERVSYLQNELDQTRAYITTQEIIDSGLGRGGNPRSRNASAYLYKSDKQNIADITGKKYGDYTGADIINYYEDLVESESALGYGGSVTGGNFRKFPKVTAALTGYYNKLIAQRNISAAEVYEDKQQQGINLVEKEYQTRFGGLSRYG